MEKSRKTDGAALLWDGCREKSAVFSGSTASGTAFYPLLEVGWDGMGVKVEADLLFSSAWCC